MILNNKHSIVERNVQCRLNSKIFLLISAVGRGKWSYENILLNLIPSEFIAFLGAENIL